MRKLPEYLRTMLVNPLGDTLVGGDGRRVPGVNEPTGHLACRVYRLALHGDQCDPATRALLVICRVSLGRHPIEGAEGGVVRLKDEAVSQRDARKPYRREEDGCRRLLQLMPPVSWKCSGTRY